MSDRIIRSALVDQEVTVTVAAANVSTPVKAAGHCIYGIAIPANFDGTEIKFDVGIDGTTFQPLRDSGNADIARIVAPEKSYELPTELAAWPWFRIRTTTNQAGTDTVFTVVGKG